MVHFDIQSVPAVAGPISTVDQQRAAHRHHGRLRALGRGVGGRGVAPAVAGDVVGPELVDVVEAGRRHGVVKAWEKPWDHKMKPGKIGGKMKPGGFLGDLQGEAEFWKGRCPSNSLSVVNSGRGSVVEESLESPKMLVTLTHFLR